MKHTIIIVSTIVAMTALIGVRTTIKENSKNSLMYLDEDEDNSNNKDNTYKVLGSGTNTITYDLVEVDATWKNYDNIPKAYDGSENMLLPTIDDINYDYHDLVGWCQNRDRSDTPITSISSDGTYYFYAKFKGMSYSITYHDFDTAWIISGHEDKFISGYEYGDDIPLPVSDGFDDDFSREGYNFIEWRTDLNDIDTGLSAISPITHGDLDLYPYFEEGEELEVISNVTFILDGGEISSEEVFNTYTEGVEKDLPVTVTKDNYNFLYWYLEGDDNKIRRTKINADDTGDLVFVAKYEPMRFKVKLFGDPLASLVYRECLYHFNSVYYLPTDVTKPNYNFSGWQDLETLEEKVEKIDKGESGDKSFTALFTKINPYVHIEFPHPTYNLTYVTNGGEILNQDFVNSYKTGEEVILPTLVNKENYSFTGWHLDHDLKDEKILRLSRFAQGDFIFYASYDSLLKSDDTNKDIYYHVIINFIDEYTNNIDDYYKENEVITLKEPSNRDGYIFNGYYLDEEFKSNNIKEVKVNNEDLEITLFTKWSKEEEELNLVLLVLIIASSLVISSVFIYYLISLKRRQNKNN